MHNGVRASISFALNHVAIHPLQLATVKFRRYNRRPLITAVAKLSPAVFFLRRILYYRDTEVWLSGQIKASTLIAIEPWKNLDPRETKAAIENRKNPNKLRKCSFNECSWLQYFRTENPNPKDHRGYQPQLYTMHWVLITPPCTISPN